MNKIINGVKNFKKNIFPRRKKFYKDLMKGQQPEVLFITCSDSRIDPNLITQTDPGEMFVVRNAGNIVPPENENDYGMTASIEFALDSLGVKNIVICGHTGCGAVKGATDLTALTNLPNVKKWVEKIALEGDIGTSKGFIDEERKINEATKENVLLQIKNLKTHKFVRKKFDTGGLTIYGWIYDIEFGTIEVFDEKTNEFVEI